MITPVDKIMKEILSTGNLENIGMVLIHKGIVRGKSKNGREVKALEVSYNPQKIEALQRLFSSYNGIEFVKIMINSGRLNVGEEIMTVIVAGRFREEVIPVFQRLLDEVKRSIDEREITI